jgi:2-keto-4-pentenoate hydratase/2-oxohepta-3-ene-1,7-dioic acid hydratase in catechol pathway
MATQIARLAQSGYAVWAVVVEGGFAVLPTRFATTAALIEQGEVEWRAARTRKPDIALGEARFLSPVTAPCRVICQGANYRQHMIESGMNPDAKNFNMFFEKSDASIAPPVGEVFRPAHVRLLDYEIELGLVMRAHVSAERAVTKQDLPDLVFGIVIANDISARDVQLPQTQFFKGKSYRGFCPVGPYLVVLAREEFGAIEALDLTLAVNGEVRQRDNTRNLVFKPAETLAELTGFSDLSPGDLLLTGTPAGCALRVPPPAVRRMMQLLGDRFLWRAFMASQGKRREYLRPGDTMSLKIENGDRAINLGEQRTIVRGTAH